MATPKAEVTTLIPAQRRFACPGPPRRLLLTPSPLSPTTREKPPAEFDSAGGIFR